MQKKALRIGKDSASIIYVPSDWHIATLEECISDFIDYRGQAPKKVKTGVPLITARNVKDGYLDFAETEYIELETYESWMSRGIPKGGDVLLTTEAPLGNVAQFPTSGKYALAQRVITLRGDEDKLDNTFLKYFFLSGFGNRALHLRSSGSTAIGIRQTELRKVEIPLPPLSEQRRIAQVLNTWDEAVRYSDQLIAAKIKMKRGFMQQLLTGKKRFPEFQQQEWIKVGAGELFKNHSVKGNKHEELLSATQDKGIIPRSMLEARVTMPTGDTGAFKLVEEGDFVISLRSFQGGLEYSYYRGIVSPAYTVLKPKKKINAEFYKQYYKSYEFIGRLATAVIGIRDGKQVSYEDFCLVKIPYPSSEEQARIAELLNACDKEIEFLKQQLGGLKQQKRGLMQKLLTGQIRVKTADESKEELVSA